MSMKYDKTYIFIQHDNSINSKNITYIIALRVADTILILNQYKIDYTLNVYTL